MAFTDAQFEAAYPTYRRRLLQRGFLPFRENLLSRDRIRPLFDLCEEFATPRREEFRGHDGGDRLADELAERFGADRKKYGIAWMWVFAIALKVIASVLIDWWLLHSSENQ